MPWLSERDPGEDLWAGPLELVASEGEQRARAEGFDPRDMPVGAIGPTECQPLSKLFSQDEMPPEARTRLETSDFYVVDLRCSFRPTTDEVTISWARFAVELLGDGEIQAVAIHPETVEDEVATTRRFRLAPSLKFMEIEAEAGELEWDFKYTALQPRVWGATNPPTAPSWDFEETKSRRLYGNRRMKLLVRANRGTDTGLARLYLVANISVKRLLIGRATIRRNADPLEVTLWSGGSATP